MCALILTLKHEHMSNSGFIIHRHCWAASVLGFSCEKKHPRNNGFLALSVRTVIIDIEGTKKEITIGYLSYNRDKHLYSVI